MGCSNGNVVLDKEENLGEIVSEVTEESIVVVEEETEETEEITEVVELSEPFEENLAEETAMTEEEIETKDEELAQRLTNLEWVQDIDQVILVVETEESRARLLYLEKTEEDFEIIFSTLAWIGSNGMGKTKEGDCKTPSGVYTLSHPFGRNDDPGCQISYVKLDDSWYWVEDGNSKYYNQMISTNDVEMDWIEAEQLNVFGYSYNYAIAIDFNKERVPGVGSAIFLHCTHNSPTRGCVAIEEELMIELLQRIREGAIIALYEDESAIE